jgi:hypothetical protein
MTTVAGPNHTIFKGGQGVAVDLDNANYNENAIVYLKKARNMVPATSGGLSGGAIAGGPGLPGSTTCSPDLPKRWEAGRGRVAGGGWHAALT